MGSAPKRAFNKTCFRGSSGGYSVSNRRILLQHLSYTMHAQYDNGRAVENSSPNGALYCSLMGAELSYSPGHPHPRKQLLVTYNNRNSQVG